ncbi:S8 family serine peptidase [Nocardia cyriacigeorgica]|uniref:S8 family serine peptidase n=1 Tax=Nocardia cyriacigeorgica TaxID=135487 RepID=UPI0024576FF0|nr:S8 family serine peptidase [Nocardia cyriacigeorgica]
MVDRRIDVQLVSGLGLPYATGVEIELTAPDSGFDIGFAAEWDAITAEFGPVTLEPTFDTVGAAAIGDISDAIRMLGEEPPDLFEWFFTEIDETLADALVSALQALPFVAWAGVAPDFYLASMVSWGTNPQSTPARLLRQKPEGVDAIYAWQVPGGRGEGVHIADVEYSWDLAHEDLAGARIVRPHPDQDTDTGHGTAVAGIVLAPDNGKGSVGVVPMARMTAMAIRGGEAAAIVEAATAVGPGGIVLVEICQPFYAGSENPDIPIEVWPPVKAAIHRETLFGITVVEPAGNGHVDLDAFPFLAHLQPASPSYVDSGAIVVGAAAITSQDPVWRRTFTTYGLRVDCFAQGESVIAPSPAANQPYDPGFGGTSAASAIICGVVASIQGMALAATGTFLHPRDIRRLVRNWDLGVHTDPPLDGLSTMPILSEIAKHQGWRPALPPALVATTAGSIALSYLDTDLHLVRREWSYQRGWTTPLKTGTSDDTYVMHAVQPAMTTGPGPHGLTLITDAVYTGPNGLGYFWWATDGSFGSAQIRRAPAGTLAGGRDLATVRPRPHTLVAIGINPAGHLVALNGDIDAKLTAAGQFEPSVVIDSVRRYLVPSNPVAVSVAPDTIDAIIIEDIGVLVWYRGKLGAPWKNPLFGPVAPLMVPTAKPAVAATAQRIDVIAVGEEGWLYSFPIDRVNPEIGDAQAVDPSVLVSSFATTALVRTGARLVALAVDIEGQLRAAHKDDGGTWSAMTVVAGAMLSPFGGVSAVAVSTGIVAVAMTSEGQPCWTTSQKGTDWTTLMPVEIDIL